MGGRNRSFQRSTDGGQTWTDELAAQNMWTKNDLSTVETIFVLPTGEGVYAPILTGTLFRRR
ncbi:hypothetical protein [Polyangium sp. 6x1]|uniref:hypothetical protein n=1 Tax=Polyangium sp. 6x1 TaxID=3042689 RepID=UPI00248282A3|nr:hypothetical protein [Polyangium sp. 6x1]MDI1444089.1 hypothetical protein [Polyangium sp. 6x1]